MKSAMETKSKMKGSKRSCKHNHGRKAQVTEETVVVPPSPIHEESNSENIVNNVDILKIEDRPTTSSSEKKFAGISTPSRPESRRLARPNSTRSVFEQIPGTRPASRRVGFY